MTLVAFFSSAQTTSQIDLSIFVDRSERSERVKKNATITGIEVFKIFKGFEDVSYNTYFTSQSGLRGRSYKVYKP